MITEAQERRAAWAVLAVAFFLGLFWRLRFGLGDFGTYWPDEVYQSLEPAHHLAFGYGLLPWEYVDGARSWLLPGVIAGLFKLVAILSNDGSALAHASRIAFAAWSSLAILGVYALARRLQASPLLAAAAAASFAFASLAIYFGPRGLTETACLPPLLFGLALAWPSEGQTRRDLILGAILVALAGWLRPHVALFGLALLAAHAWRRETRALRDVTLTFAAVLLAYGLLDLATYGAFAVSAKNYLTFNLIEGRASEFGRAPPALYTRALLRSLGPLWPAWALLALASARHRHARILLGAAALFFVLHLVIPHKEARFLYPWLGVLAALSGPGLQALGRARLAVALLALAVFSSTGLSSLTFGDLGIRNDEHPSAWGRGDAENRLLFEAGREPTLCGLHVQTEKLENLGGLTYLHRDVPLYGRTNPPPDPGMVNFAIQSAADGSVRLSKLHDGPCLPDATYQRRIR